MSRMAEEEIKMDPSLSDASRVRNCHAGLLRHIACTAIDIDDDVWRAAKELARREKTTPVVTTRPEAATVEDELAEYLVANEQRLRRIGDRMDQVTSAPQVTFAALLVVVHELRRLSQGHLRPSSRSISQLRWSRRRTLLALLCPEDSAHMGVCFSSPSTIRTAA
jgi:hypothetical protein